jgi:multiple sugar transport system substrate-binding protein
VALFTNTMIGKRAESSFTFCSFASLILSIGLVLSVAIVYASFDMHFALAQSQQQNKQNKQQVTLTAMLTDLGNPTAWNSLFQSALSELRTRHPDMDINLNYKVFPYNQTRSQLLEALGNKTPVDLVSVDQIWLGEFAEKEYVTDLTDRVKSWGRASDWYQTNFAGGVYKGKVYGIWTTTDVRSIWYWKDLLNQAGIDPNMLKTWDSYIASLKKINNTFRGQGGIQAGLVICGGAEWYPYLWELGGDVLVQKDGHPTKGTYWFPAYNSSAGVKALQFYKDQINAGIKPILSNVSGMGTDFANKKYAVWIAPSGLPGSFPPDQRKDLEKILGLVPIVPVPNQNTQTATLLGGWEFSIPTSSKNKELAWELLTIMLEPKVISTWYQQTGLIPTQKTVGSGPELTQLNQTIPYYDDMISEVPFGRSRPNIPQFAQIDQQVSYALDQVCSGTKEPKQALDEAAAKSAKLLGW